ncbi:phosphoribosylanthranilate isomerase [Holophaga foetida]|uniref:phosphoribosylanthranilate isomerase n=1 Tax=Holophaga foetida TaxID=35839 RepID=UPI0002474622|nr:phosphoribosylanthranilate isomerase [Holophaga foetida]
MPPVKVCGLTRSEDALLAWELGASALGFIFHPRSPRAVTAAQVAAIRAALPPEAITVGVFVDWEAERVNEAVQEAGLSLAQLHGHEGPELAARIQVPVIKVIWEEEARDEGLLRAYEVAAFLLDASHPTLPGGTGLRSDWALARELAQRHPLILAGGLNPLNAREAWDSVHPAALDLASGVEASPGVKDPAKLRALFQTLTGLESENSVRGFRK